jgi:hypothetical protein
LPIPHGTRIPPSILFHRIAGIPGISFDDLMPCRFYKNPPVCRVKPFYASHPQEYPLMIPESIDA